MAGPVGRKPIDFSKITAPQAANGKRQNFLQRMKARFLPQKKPAVKKAEKAAEAKKIAAKEASVQKIASEKASAEQQQATSVKAALDERAKLGLMAQKAAGSQTFAKICADAGWKDPQQAFLHYYEALQRNPNIATMEFDAMMDARSKGEKTFSRTKFYMQLIAQHLAKTKKP